MRRLLTLAALVALAVALLILIAPAAAIGRLTGIAPAEALLQGGGSAMYIVIALARLLAGLLIVIACLMLAVRPVGQPDVRAFARLTATGLAAFALLALVQAQAIFDTPTSWVVGAAGAVLAALLVLVARPTPAPAA
jgi:hypothetical protein